MKRPFSLNDLRQRFASADIYPEAPDPRSFLHSADIFGMTSSALGYERFGFLLHDLRRVAAQETDNSYALSTVRDEKTHQKIGMRIHAAHQATVNQIAHEMRMRMPVTCNPARPRKKKKR